MALESAEALLRDGADASRYDAFLEQHSRCYSFEDDVYKQLFNTIISEVKEPQWAESHDGDWTGVLRVLQCLRLLTRNTVFLNRVIEDCPTRQLLDELLRDIRTTKSTVHGACVCEVLAIVNRIACADLDSLARLNFIEPLVQASSIIVYPMIVRCALETLAGASSDPDVLATVADLTNYPALLQVATRSSGHQHLALKLLADLCFYPPAQKRFRQLCPFAGQSLLFWAQGAKALRQGADDEKSEHCTARIQHCLQIFEAFAQHTTTYPNTVQEMVDIGILKPMIGLFDFPNDAVKAQMLTTLSHMALQDDACAMALTKNHLQELLREIRSTHDVARHTARLLRFTFAVERNRQAFKRVFPTCILGPFVDIGHYVWDLNAYEPFVAAVAGYDTPFSDIAKEETPLLLGTYKVVESLGEGAYGKVYLGTDEHGIEVALKEVNLTRSSTTHHLSQEVALLQSADHPNIIMFLDSFIVKQKLIIVMEYCPGISLQMFLENGVAKKLWGPGLTSPSMPEPTCWDIFLQLALALRYLHVEKNITHRDLSANNVLLMPQTMNVKLADFGLAKQSADHMLSAVGTILYSCPEIVQHHAYTHKADIWSLGCLLYKMAVMEDPFSGSNSLVIARRIVECDYKELDETHSPLRRKVTAMCFTVDPVERPTISQVLELLTPVFVMRFERKLREEKAALATDVTKRAAQANVPRKMTIPQNAVVERDADPVDAILDVLVALVRKADAARSDANVDPKVTFFSCRRTSIKRRSGSSSRRAPIRCRAARQKAMLLCTKRFTIQSRKSGQQVK